MSEIKKEVKKVPCDCSKFLKGECPSIIKSNRCPAGILPKNPRGSLDRVDIQPLVSQCPAVTLIKNALSAISRFGFCGVKINK